MINCGNCYYSYKEYNGQAGNVLCDLKHCRMHISGCCDDWRKDKDEEDVE